MLFRRTQSSPDKGLRHGWPQTREEVQEYLSRADEYDEIARCCLTFPEFKIKILLYSFRQPRNNGE